MVHATLEDLRLELWLRRRNAGIIQWTTRMEVNIPIKEMSDEHLFNTIKMLEKAKAREEEKEEERYQVLETGIVDPYDCC